MRKAREAGTAVEVRTIQLLPVRKLDYWPETVEYGLLHGRQLEVVRDVFKGLDETAQHALTFTPVTGGWADRARFWQQQLRPVLPPATYHAVMMKFISWYKHCLRLATGVSA